jgi:hypothetical protein
MARICFAAHFRVVPPSHFRHLKSMAEEKLCLVWLQRPACALFEHYMVFFNRPLRASASWAVERGHVAPLPSSSKVTVSMHSLFVYMA